MNQLAKKFDENHAVEEQYNTIILHVGTNDLVREEPKKVAADMESLINKEKAHTNCDQQISSIWCYQAL
jgi:hypothetical protein